MVDLGRRIWDARLNGELLDRAEIDAVTSRRDAYKVQVAATQASGLTRAGWKVAATSAAAEAMLGVDGPSIGPVFAEHISATGSVLEARPEQGTGVECELAFVMNRTLDGDGEISRDDVVAATETVRIAIEIVGCRFEGGFKNAGSYLCISDFSFNAGFVPGAEIADWKNVDLKSVTAKLLLNGEVANQGVGSDVLGDPVEALRWAANEAKSIGLPFQGGDIITTGTMTGATLVHPGDHVVGDFGPLGQIALSF